MSTVQSLVAALGDVLTERGRQDAKWAEQNHPDGTGPATQPLRGMFSDARADVVSGAMRQRCQSSTVDGGDNWADILLEEVFEAIAEEPGSRGLREELVQVAALTIQWVEAIDRRVQA